MCYIFSLCFYLVVLSNPPKPNLISGLLQEDLCGLRDDIVTMWYPSFLLLCWIRMRPSFLGNDKIQPSGSMSSWAWNWNLKAQDEVKCQLSEHANTSNPQHCSWNGRMFFLLLFFTVLPKAVVMALCTVRKQADGCSEVPALCFLHKSKLRMNVYKELWDSWHWKWYCKQKRFLWCCYFF